MACKCDVCNLLREIALCNILCVFGGVVCCLQFVMFFLGGWVCDVCKLMFFVVCCALYVMCSLLFTV